MTRLVLPMALVVLLAGCGSVPPGSTYMSKMGGSPSTSSASAVPVTSGAIGLSQGKGSSRIDAGDSVLQLPQFASYYKVFRVEPEQMQLKAFTVTSYCACFGMDKRLMVPVAFGLSSSGEMVHPLTKRYEFHKASGITPLSLSLDVQFNQSDVAYLVVAADNSRVDANIVHLHIDGTVNRIPFTVDNDVRTYPIGRFDIQVGASN
ncbi:hypothetical protein [Dyella terrae]|uniref:hypothetical protein n=1 Tax=Dyella terrae TaxID=522259 RepID=UPI001EFD0C44|nr:hypothetical protein [Dyella terrae]ULU24951.1 hypothetical protein DYST_01871 [Dyella terrae]